MKFDDEKRIQRSTPPASSLAERRKRVKPSARVRYRKYLITLTILFMSGAVFGVVSGVTVEPPSTEHATKTRPLPRVENGAAGLRVWAYSSPVKKAKGSRNEGATTGSGQRIEARANKKIPKKVVTAVKSTTKGRSRPQLAALTGSPENINEAERRFMPNWLKYAALTPEIVAGQPRIAIVLDDLGLVQSRTRRAITLAAPLTMAFLPYGHNLKKLTNAAREAGHELIVHLPMEPDNIEADPGLNALYTTLKAKQIRERVAWGLSRFSGFVGVSNHMGSRFTKWRHGIDILLKEIKSKDLLFLDSLTSQKSLVSEIAERYRLPYAVRDVFLDNDQAPEAIRAQLKSLTAIARRRGYAIGIGHPYDSTIDVLREWIARAPTEGLSLVPLSQIVRQRWLKVSRGAASKG